MNKPHIRWKMADVLEHEGVTVYALHQQLGNKVSRNTLYRLAKEQPERVPLDITAQVLQGLRLLTGRHYEVADLLEYEAPESMDAETKAWMDSDLSRLGEYEPYDWGDTDPETLGKPIYYSPGKGFMVDDDA